MTVTRWLFRRHSLWLLVLLAGCGHKGPELAVVEGTVIWHGKSLGEAEVMFVPRQGGRPAVGRTDEQGRFQLTTFQLGDGALVGEHDVAVAKIAPTIMPPSTTGPLSPLTAMPVEHKWLIPARYGDSKTSGLKATVVSGINAFTFELTP